MVKNVIKKKSNKLWYLTVLIPMIGGIIGLAVNIVLFIYLKFKKYDASKKVLVSTIIGWMIMVIINAIASIMTL